MLWFTALISMGEALEIPHEQFQLDNGLNVILVEDHKLPQVVVNTWYGVGSFDDPTGASGFAHLFEHLMFMGTTQIPDNEFDVRMEVAGGWNNASTADDRTNYYDVGGSNILDLLLFMEADRMVNLDITQKKLDLQRDVVRNERRQNYEDAPYGSIWLEMPEMMYPSEHPYSLEGIGSHEDLMAATLDTVSQFYDQWYQPANASLCIAGDFNSTEVKERIQAYYGQIKAKEAMVHTEIDLPRQPQMAEKTITDNVPLPAMLMMWHSPVIFQEGDAEADVLSQVLTGRADAFLTKQLVYDQSLVQDVSVFQYSRGRGSVFIVYIDALEDTDLEQVEGIVLKTLQELGDGTTAIESSVLSAIINNWEMEFLWGLEDIQEKAETLQRYNHYLGQPDYLAKDLARYQNVTPEGIQRVINNYFTKDKMAKLIVMPEESDSEEGEAQ
jgi:predicted Zn-dependent peptidase